MAISEIAKIFNMVVRTTQKWLQKAARCGISALYDKKPKGVPSKLSKG